MNSLSVRDVALLAARIIVALIFVWHGAEKAFYPGVGFDKFVDMGFPGTLGPIIGGIEVLGALLLIAGWQIRYVSMGLAAIIVVAVIGVQLPNGYQTGLERDLLILVSLGVLFASGAGKYALVSQGKSDSSKRSYAG